MYFVCKTCGAATIVDYDAFNADLSARFIRYSGNLSFFERVGIDFKSVRFLLTSD